MSVTVLLFVTVFLLAVVAFAVAIGWVSVRSAAHTPKALQSESTGGGEQ